MNLIRTQSQVETLLSIAAGGTAETEESVAHASIKILESHAKLIAAGFREGWLSTDRFGNIVERSQGQCACSLLSS